MEIFPGPADIVSEITAGSVGALFVGGAALLVQWFKRFRVERRFPLKGEYLSFFEDLNDGQRVVITSTSRIRQKGRRIEIQNKMDEGRSWTLEGSILAGGHISGVYSADPTYDEGVGSFYLRIHGESLDGVWSGYDHVNKITSGGRYWFRRVANIEIRNGTHDDINEVLATSVEAFGSGYVSAEDLVSQSGASVLVAESEGEFAGFCLSRILERDAASSMLKAGEHELPDQAKFSDQTGTLAVIKTIAVRRKWHGRGVGTALVKAAEAWLSEKGAQCIIVPAWTVEGKAALSGMLQRLGYGKWGVQEEYWKEGCEQKLFRCNSFDGKCVCSVIFYGKSCRKRVRSVVTA